MMDYGKTILSYQIEKRKRIREQLNKVSLLTKEQREKTYNLFIQPLDDRIKLIDDFSKNKISNNQYLTRLEQINKRIQEVFKEVKK